MADVTNYTIENASGANVRTDLNNVFAAIQSSNSKSTDLTSSQCVAGMIFLNTSGSKILKVRNSSNNAFTEIGSIDSANLGLLPRAGGTMTGQLLIDDSSSASSPALSFDADSDTGFFRKSANKIGVSAAGTERFFFDDNGITFNNQRQIRFGDNDSSHYIGLRAASTIGSNFTLTLPTADGSNGQFLTTNGSGALSFTSLSGSVTVGSTSISLGGTATTVAGLTSLTSTTLSATNVQATNVQATNLKGTNIQDTSGNNGSTPEQIQNGRAKAWVLFSSDGTKNADFGVSSVTNSGTGNYVINFSSAFANTNYAYALSASRGGTSTSTGARIATQEGGTGKTTTQFQLKIRNTNNTVSIPGEVSAIFYAA